MEKIDFRVKQMEFSMKRKNIRHKYTLKISALNEECAARRRVLEQERDMALLKLTTEEDALIREYRRQIAEATKEDNPA